MIKNEYLKNNEGVFPTGKLNEGYRQFFIGDSYLHGLITDHPNIGIYNVTFEPGCRNNWHLHTEGQILLVTGGEGWYQEEGKKAQKLKTGDVVNIPANIKHWHGAVKDSWFSHLAISININGNKTEWFEAVEDKEYGKL